MIQSRNGFVLLLILLAGFAIFFELGRMDIATANEGQRATPPAEMLRSGDFIVPTLNGVDYLVKPPLLYWAIAGVYAVTGTISEWTARVPTAVCGILLVLALYLLTRKEAGEGPARWGAIALIASPYILERCRWAGLDIPLTLSTMVAILVLRKAALSETPGRRIALVVAGGLAMGAAVMLKGPVPHLFLWAAWIASMIADGPNADRVMKPGIRWSLAIFVVEVVLYTLKMMSDKVAETVTFPVTLVAAMALWTALGIVAAGPTRIRQTAVWLSGMFIGTLMALPWGLAVLHRKGWPWIEAMLNDQVFERTHTASEINSGSPFFFYLNLIAMFAPWAVLFLFQFSPSQWRARPPIYRFCVLASWVAVLIFSLIAGKEREYVMPGMPLAVLACGFHLHDLSTGALQGWMAKVARWWRPIAHGFALVGAFGVIVYGIVEVGHPVLIVELALLASLAVVVTIHARRGNMDKTFALALVFLIAVLGGLNSRSFRLTGENSPKVVGQLAGVLLSQGHTVECSKLFAQVDFYINEEIPTVLSAKTVADRLNGDKPYFYITYDKNLKLMGGYVDPDEIHILARGGHPGGHSSTLILIGNTIINESE